jgi:hypothetical protein
MASSKPFLRLGLDLLRLQHEGAAPVAVDEAVGFAAVAVAEAHAALEDVGVVARVVARRVGPRQAEQLGELADEELVVGALRAAGGLPAGNEALDAFVCHGHGGVYRNRPGV